MSLLSDHLSKSFEEVYYKDFYRDIFPEGSLEKKGEYVDGMYNGIIVEVTKDKGPNGKPKVLRHTLTDDLDKLDEVVNRDNFCLMSPISYAGKSRDSSNARDLYALTFDLDGIQTKIKDGKVVPYGLDNFYNQVSPMEFLPKPTYIVASGTGVHLYYVFEKPIPMFDNVVDQLERLKKQLTKMMWHGSISTLEENIQYEPVCQGFRVVGTITKNGERAKCYRTGTKVTVEYLNQFVYKENRVTSFSYKSDLTLAAAKKKYPVWYQERIVEKRPRMAWKFDRAVYDKWLSRLQPESTVGHRYWAIWSLAVTAMKCGISEDELERDAFSLLDAMNKKDKEGNKPFTEDDILAALSGYDSKWLNYPIDKMSYRTGITLVKNTRKGRPRNQHLIIARGIQKNIDEIDGTNWREGNGRKTKEDKVIEWKKEHPSGTKMECFKETGLSRPTIDKYWNKYEISSNPTRDKILLWKVKHPNGSKSACFRDTGLSRTTIDKYWNEEINADLIKEVNKLEMKRQLLEEDEIDISASWGNPIQLSLFDQEIGVDDVEDLESDREFLENYEGLKK